MSYAEIKSHRRMVTDNRRNDIYSAALNQLVTAESIVLDLGAGLGLHGLLAAKLGAKRVYLVEPQDIINVTKQIARDNGLGENVYYLHGQIEDVTVPEPVDIIVSVFTGNFLFTEDLLPSLFHARDSYLKPGGIMVPDRAELVVAPVNAPELYADEILSWSAPQQGLNYKKAKYYASNSVYYPQSGLKNSTYLAEPTIMTALNFYQATDASCQASSNFKINNNGLCHGLAGWIRIHVGQQWLSTAPQEPDTHWKPVFLPIDPPLEMHAGEEIQVKLLRPVGGDWTWEIHTPNEKRIHSTFFALPLSKEKLLKANLSFQPSLNEKGKAVKYLIERFDGRTSVQELAEELRSQFPEQFHEPGDSLKFIRRLLHDFSQ